MLAAGISRQQPDSRKIYCYSSGALSFAIAVIATTSASQLFSLGRLGYLALCSGLDLSVALGQSSRASIAVEVTVRAPHPHQHQPEGSDPESQNSGTAERIRPQELEKNLQVPMIRWGEVRAEEDTLAGEIKELHRGKEIGRSFGPPLPRSAD